MTNAVLTRDLTAWLRDTDPALRWQVERDLLGEPPEVWQATRARVATEGFGARLLALQDADGQWAGGAFFPSDFHGDEEQPWTATTWTLNALREWGLDAEVLRGTAELLAENARWEYDSLPYWGGEVDCCINAWTVQNGLWLGADVTVIVDWFVAHQLPDGGWNCEWVNGAKRSSFHSTLNSLKGLLAYDAATGGTDATRAARRAGEEYLLRRGLFRRLSTGEPVAPWVDHFAYPFRWFYSVLNAAEYFRQATLVDGTTPDPRMADAIELIRAARQPDGTWLQGRRHPGRVWFEVDVPAGEPSKWLTLFGSRVLDWWNTHTAATYRLDPIGHVSSPLVDRTAAPKQGTEGGAPQAWLVFRPEVAAGLADLAVGTEVLVLTWLHQADRDVLAVHPRDDPRNPLTGVFSTRSADRPNPIGLHRVQIVAIDGTRVLVRDLEAVDGTPIVDLKPVLAVKPVLDGDR